MEAVHWGTGPLATEKLATWYRQILATGHRTTGHMVQPDTGHWATGHRATGHVVQADTGHWSQSNWPHGTGRYWALGHWPQSNWLHGTGLQILGTGGRRTVGTGHRVSTDFNIMGHWAQKDTRNLGHGID